MPAPNASGPASPGLPDVARRTLQDTFERTLASSADDLAYVDSAGQWTYAESFARSTRLGAGIRKLGVEAQQPVALMLDNSVDYVHFWMGLGLLNTIEVPVNTAYKRGFLSHVLNDSRSEVLVIEDRYVERVAEIANDLAQLRTVVIRGDLAAGNCLPTGIAVLPFEELATAAPTAPVPADPAALLAYMYTSGTTGRSKGVMCSQAYAYTYASQEDVPGARPAPGDRVLVTIPLFHMGGQWAWTYQCLIHRAACFIEPGFSLSQFWPTVRKHNITVTGLFGSMGQLLWQQPAQFDDHDNPLEVTPMAPAVADLDAFRRRFGVEVFTGYGMSEIGRVTDGPIGTVLADEVGFGRQGYDLRLVDEHGRDVPVGQAGELLVRPAEPLTITPGYVGLPDKSAELIRDGWVHTQDVLRQDETGRYYFADRLKDALRRRGENVSSFEVERVINEHPAVLESAVVAVPSEHTEDDIRAVIVLRPEQRLDTYELTQFLVDRLPYFMVPRYLEVVDELPKTPTMKIQKQQLRDAGLGTNAWDREAAGIRLRSGR